MGNYFKDESGVDEIKKGESEESAPMSNEKMSELNSRVSLLGQRLLHEFAYPLGDDSLCFENIPISFREDGVCLRVLIYV